MNHSLINAYPLKKSLVALLTISSLFVSQASYANTVSLPPEDDTEVLIGLGSGIALGAVIAGPVGAIVGAFAGTLIGKSASDDDALHAQQVRLEEQAEQLTSLAKKQQSLDMISSQYALAQKQLNELKNAEQAKLTELALGLNVQFRTGSSEIEPHFQQQLNDVAYAMSLSPELTLDLTGYADRRGDDAYNQALSEQRLVEVRNYLMKQGVDSARLTTQAYGASLPLKADQTFENDFFDRRVTLKLQPKSNGLTASQ